MESNIESKRERIGELDRIDDVFGRETEELIERKKTSVEVLRDLVLKEQMLCQKTKARWIKDWGYEFQIFPLLDK